MGKSNELKAAWTKLRALEMQEGTNPPRVEIALDALASALVRIPEIKKVLGDEEAMSLSEVLELLISKDMLSAKVLSKLEEVESALERVDYNGLEEEDENLFDSELERFCGCIEILLQEIESK